MSISQLHAGLTAIPNPRKLSRENRESILQDERDKLSDMIDLFYQKAKAKIDKTLTKDSKRATLLCKQLLGELALYPKQEVYEISRLSDEFFNEMDKLNSTISEFLKSVESLREKIAKELCIQKEKICVKQQKEAIGEYHIAVLRKINFKKERTLLSQKLKDIDTLNKKLVKFQVDPDDKETGCSIEIDGKKVQAYVQRYKKIVFESKRREYLLCLSCKIGTEEGYLSLYSDKLQKIASFNHLSPISITTFKDIVQIDDYLFIVYTNQVTRISLTNEFDQKAILIKDRINKAETISGELALWIEDSSLNHSVIFLNDELEIVYHEYLRINVKSIGIHFKIHKQQEIEQVYFVGRTTNGSNDLFRVQKNQVELVVKDVGTVEEVVQCKVEGKVEQVLLRKGGELYRFSCGGLKQRMIQIDMENGQSMQKCCILGQHFYALHQSGKILLQCHFKVPLDENNPEP